MSCNLYKHLNCALRCKQIYKTKQYFKILPKQNMIVLEGTRSLKQLSYSLNAFKIEDTHRGYNSYAKYMYKSIDWSSLNNKTPLTITAHSLGAVCALIMATKYINTFDHMDLILFGSTKPGGDIFREQVQKTLLTNHNLQIYNYINKFDFISEFPYYNYVHAVDPIILEQSNIHMQPIKNHKMDSYVESMKNFYNLFDK